jgi:membrane-bound ClpP family serine protease
MKWLLLAGILASVAALAALIVVALYIHKRNGSGDVKLIGEIAQVDTKLDPEGTVIVCGELWRAKSKDGAHLSKHTRVRVVAFVDQLALVEVCE